MIAAMSSSDSAVPRLTFFRLCVSEADTTASISASPLSSARAAPRRFGTSAEYRTAGALVIRFHTSSASAICGIAAGRTNETASIRLTPVADSRSISSILASVGTGSSFCSPSRGPTSRTEIRPGRSLTVCLRPAQRAHRGPLAASAAGLPGYCPGHWDAGPPARLVPWPFGRTLLLKRRDALLSIPGERGGPPGSVLDLEADREAHARALPDGPLSRQHGDRRVACYLPGERERVL